MQRCSTPCGPPRQRQRQLVTLEAEAKEEQRRLHEALHEHQRQMQALKTEADVRWPPRIVYILSRARSSLSLFMSTYRRRRRRCLLPSGNCRGKNNALSGYDGTDQPYAPRERTSAAKSCPTVYYIYRLSEFVRCSCLHTVSHPYPHIHLQGRQVARSSQRSPSNADGVSQRGAQQGQVGDAGGAHAGIAGEGRGACSARAKKGGGARNAAAG